MMWHGYGWGFGLFGWAFMGLFWLVIIGLLVWAAVTLLPRARSGGNEGRGGPGAPGWPGQPGTPGWESPEDILDRRFARGEIDVEQYRQARQELAAARSGKNRGG